MSKLARLKKYFTSSGKIKSYINQLVYEDKLAEILNKYSIYSLPQVDAENLFSVLGENTVPLIKIKVDFTGGISPVNDYYMLCRIAKAINASKYFEIGTWLGLSAYNVNLNSQNTVIYTLDIPLDHEEITLYKIPQEVFGFYTKNIKNVHHLKGDSKFFDYKPYANSFDLVFVDGNHSLEYVINDTKIALKLLKNDNSIIAWHDYILCGEINNNVLCGILEAIPVSEHKHIIHLYQSNIALYSRSFRFPEKYFDKWCIPSSNYELSVKQQTRTKIE